MLRWCFLLLALPVFSQDWSQWRGPTRDGQAQSWIIPDQPAEPRQLWRVDAGEGHASPVVWQDLVILIFRKGEDEVVSAFRRANGDPVWQDHYPAPFHVNGYATSHGKGTKATPIVANGILVTFGIEGTISAYNAHNGKVLWRKRHFPKPKISDKFVCPPCGMPCDEKLYDKGGTCPADGCRITLTPQGADTSGLFCGAASSPLVLGDNLIVHSGGSFKGALAAYRLKSGDLIWERPGPGPGYASPILLSFAGVPQVVGFTQKSVFAVDPATGKDLWEMAYPEKYNENIITPIQFGDLLLLSNPTTPLQAFSIAHEAGRWSQKESWRDDAITLYMSSPVRSGDLIFAFNKKNKGQLVCLDPSSGKVHWRSPGRLGRNASLLVSGDKLAAMSTDGVLYLFRANKEMKEIAHFEVSNSAVWAHLVPDSDARFFIRNQDSLALWSF